MFKKKRLYFVWLVWFAVIHVSCDGDSPMGPEAMTVQRAFVVNSTSNTISVIELDSLTVRNDVIDLGPNSTAVGFSFRGQRAIVPNGRANNVVVLDTENLTVEGIIDLPEGSGATGSAFFNNTIAFVGNLNLNSVSRIDLQSMTWTDTIAVGIAPSDIAVANGKVFVINSNVDFTTFEKLGNGTISVIDPNTLQVTNTIDAGATNSQFIGVDLEGDLIVVNSGDFGAGNGTVSVIDPETETLTTGPVTIGDFPGSFNINSDGVAYIASFSAGLYVFNTRTNTVVRGADNPLSATDASGNPLGSAGVDFDDDDNIYSVHFGDGVTPGTVFMFNSAETLVDSVKVGIGPFAIEIP
ncbi:hypothetical protein GWN42_04075 [candidate division KSB1 bacterium]|nr:hypothetical protein [candidate division KSB1 bacterium]